MCRCTPLTPAVGALKGGQFRSSLAKSKLEASVILPQSKLKTEVRNLRQDGPPRGGISGNPKGIHFPLYYYKLYRARGVVAQW